MHTLRKLAELSLAHAATFAFPLVFVVVCGRTLGVHDYGVVSLYTALAAFLGVLIEFGFDWYGTREVAQSAADTARCRRILWNVTAARLLVCAVVGVVSTGALLMFRGSGEWPLILASAFYLFGFALDANWYLRALERTQLLLRITVGVRMAGVVLLVLIVTAPGDLAAALWSYAFISLATSALTWIVLLRLGLAARAPVDFGDIARLLRGSGVILFGNLNGAMLTNGGIALLGFTADPATVGAANLALRVRMAGDAVLLPLKQLGFVRISSFAKDSRARAVNVGRRVLVALVAVATVVAAIAAWSAPWVAHYVFKAELPTAIGLIALLALSIPVNAAGNLFGMQSLIAFGHERAYTAILLVAAFGFCMVVAFARDPLAYGWALLLAEVVVMILSALRLRVVVAEVTR